MKFKEIFKSSEDKLKVFKIRVAALNVDDKKFILNQNELFKFLDSHFSTVKNNIDKYMDLFCKEFKTFNANQIHNQFIAMFKPDDYYRELRKSSHSIMNLLDAKLLNTGVPLHTDVFEILHYRDSDDIIKTKLNKYYRDSLLQYIQFKTEMKQLKKYLDEFNNR